MPALVADIIYLHIAVHRLWLTSHALRTCLRSPSCVPLRTVARLPRVGKSRPHSDGIAGESNVPRPVFRPVHCRADAPAGLPQMTQYLLQYGVTVRCRDPLCFRGPGSSDAHTACQHVATACGNAVGAGIMPG